MPNDDDPDFEEKFRKALVDPSMRLICDAARAPIKTLQQHLDNGAVIATRDPMMGFTPLHSAADTGNWTNVQWLMDRGSRWTNIDAKGKIPMQVALREGHRECFDLMFEKTVEQGEPWRRFHTALLHIKPCFPLSEYCYWYGKRPPFPPLAEWETSISDLLLDNAAYLRDTINFGIPQDPDTLQDFKTNGQFGVYYRGSEVMTESERPLSKRSTHPVCFSHNTMHITSEKNCGIAVQWDAENKTVSEYRIRSGNRCVQSPHIHSPPSDSSTCIDRRVFPAARAR